MAISVFVVRFNQNIFNMIKTLLQKSDFNWYFISLLCFVLVLPFSQALVSIFGGIVLGVALLEDSVKNKIKRFNENRFLLFIPAIFLIYLLSFIINYKTGNSFYDLQKALFYFVIPLAFMIGKPVSGNQKRFLFYSFGLAIFVATVIALINFYLGGESENFGIHKISLISHIRFSFQLILIFWFFVFIAYYNRNRINKYTKTALLLLALYFLVFLFFQQSLTGLIAFGASLLFAVFLLIQTQIRYRIILLSIFTGFAVVPLIYVFWIVNSFYDIEKINRDTIEKTTALGNFYEHDFENPAVENGHYTYLYVCHDEMREEWNKISTKKYDDLLPNGFPLYSTLIRYMTSKGLKKDADGIKLLTAQDIQNVENGISNFIFQQKKYTLYPRIYQTVWEFYMYSETGNPNYQSFSQRIEFTRAAITIIKENFWFGVGAGNWKEEFKKAYISNKSKLEENLYASSHNQYLNYMVKFGFSGFLLIMVFMIYPVVKSKSYRDPLFMIFLVFLFFANFADSNFETHMGSSFFLFFYCLFVVYDKDSYLILSDKSINPKSFGSV
jgi:hypothetical protein